MAGVLEKLLFDIGLTQLLLGPEFDRVHPHFGGLSVVSVPSYPLLEEEWCTGHHLHLNGRQGLENMEEFVAHVL